MDQFIGIDFGSTFYRTAVQKEGAAGKGEVLHKESELPYIIERSNEVPDFRFRSIKQKIGFEETVPLSGKETLVIDIVSNIFRSVREQAREALGSETYTGILTVPSCFVEKQRAALKTSAENGGFETVKLLDESMAAALALKLKTEGETSLIYAFGGGVFTVSIIRIVNGVPQALWHEGDRNLGGNDFDAAIISYLIEKYKLESSISKHFSSSIHDLKSIAEDMKLGLSHEETVEAEFSLRTQSIREQSMTMRLNRPEFESVISDHVQKSIHLTRKAVEGAGITGKNIDSVVLMGGSTRVPLVEEMVRREFGDKVVRGSDDLVLSGTVVYGTQLPKPARKVSKLAKTHVGPHTSDTDSLEKKGETVIEAVESSWLKMFDKKIIKSEAFWKKGEHDKAIGELEETQIDLSKYISILYYNRGKIQFNSDDFDSAILNYQQGLKLDKNNISIRSAYHEVCRRKADVLIEEHKYTEARSIINVGLQLYPGCKACSDMKKNIDAFISRRAHPRRSIPSHSKKGKKRR